MGLGDGVGVPIDWFHTQQLVVPLSHSGSHRVQRGALRAKHGVFAVLNHRKLCDALPLLRPLNQTKRGR